MFWTEAGLEKEFDDREFLAQQGVYGRGGDDYGPNPDYYHSWYPVDEILNETPKAYFIRRGDFRVWVAKSLIRSWKKDKSEMFVHAPSYREILKKFAEDQRSMLDDLPDMGE